MKALICGYGRAGQRHGEQLEKRGIAYDVFDYKEELRTVESSFPLGYDFCVIATPPDQHLEQLGACAAHDVPVLVEKPLCGFDEDIGRLAEYDKVRVAYNYRYHPAIQKLKNSRERYEGGWYFYSKQYRPSLPEWGLLLDHLPHTVDVLLYLSGMIPDLTIVVETKKKVMVAGVVGEVPLVIIDEVVTESIPKEAQISCPLGGVEVDTDFTMFDKMWDDFLAGNYTGLTDAIQIQETLDEAKLIAR